VVIATAATLSAVANVTATVRVARFAACAAALVFTPVAIDTMHSTSVAKVAVAAVSVTFAVAVPEFAATTVNVVVPHPLFTGVAKEVNLKVGRTNATLSLTFSGAFNLNLYVIDDAFHVTGFAIVNTLFVTAGVTTSVDVVIAVAAIFVAPTSTTAAVLVFRLAACAVAGVVIPLAIFTVHCARAPINAVAAVNVTAAVAAPEFEAAAVKVVDPQPLIVGVAKLPRTKFGSTIVITSPTARTAFNANVNDADVLADVAGSEMLRTL
jgi:hypothetical protein